MKTCSRCGSEKPLSKFCKRKGRRDGVEGICRRCRIATSRANAISNPDARRRATRNFNRRKNGWPNGLVEQRLAEQGFMCPICGLGLDGPDVRVHSDHDHVTGAPRGVLCPDCNFGLGRFKDNTHSLARAIEYLHHYQGDGRG